MLSIVAPLLLLAGAQAAPRVVIDLDSAALAAAGADEDDLRTTLASELEKTFQLEASPVLMEKLARSNAAAVRGLGLDYASNPELFVFGLSVGTAVNGAGFDLFDRDSALLPANGFTAQAGVLAGLNLGAFTPGTDTLLDRFFVATNAMRAAPSVGSFQATVWTWGLHGQYAVLMPVEKGVLTWGGLDLSTGFDLARSSIALTQTMPIDGGVGTWQADGTYALSAKATTVPLELSTSASVPGLSLWLGLAADLAPGARATRSVSLAGDITADEGSGSFGTVTAEHDERVDVRPMGGRLFTGLQFDITAVKIYSQLNLSTDRSVGMHAGLRVAM